MRHHEEVYQSLSIEHLKRVLMNRCLPDSVQDKIRFKRTMEEGWKFLDNVFMKPYTFFRLNVAYHLCEADTGEEPGRQWR
jgi:hypothetical protein